MIPGCILDGILRESRYGSIGDAITDTGRRHGRAEGDADPWDYTASEMAHAIAEWHSVRLARDYLTAYAEGFAEGTEARKLRRADSASEMLAPDA